MNSAVGLVVIWPVARRREKGAIDRVLADVRSRFNVLAQFDRAWPIESAELNYERFYCDRPYSGRTLRRVKGAGKFTVVVIEDVDAQFDYRDAPQGVEVVNTNFFDAKRKYREWLGREHAVHISDHEREGARDIALMLGPDALTNIRSGEDVQSDTFVDELWGSKGWKTVNEGLSLLNQAARYLVLNDPAGSHPLAVLTDDYLATLRALNAVRGVLVLPKWGGLFSMVVGGTQIGVEVRFVGDGYLPSGFASDMLDRRTIVDGVYQPCARDIISLHRYGTKVGLNVGQFESKELPITQASSTERPGVKTSDEIQPSVPRDLTASFDFRRAGYDAPLLRNAIRRLQGVEYTWRLRMHQLYAAARRRLSDALPLFGRMRRRLRKLMKKRRSRFAARIRFR